MEFLSEVVHRVCACLSDLTKTGGASEAANLLRRISSERSPGMRKLAQHILLCTAHNLGLGTIYNDASDSNLRLQLWDGSDLGHTSRIHTGGWKALLGPTP